VHGVGLGHGSLLCLSGGLVRFKNRGAFCVIHLIHDSIVGWIWIEINKKVAPGDQRNPSIFRDLLAGSVELFKFFVDPWNLSIFGLT
jgi:hypothetical protein